GRTARAAQRDADARRHVQPLAPGTERLVERLLDPVRDAHRRLAVPHVVDEYGELVAAQPCECVLRTEQELEATGNVDQQAVTRRMTEAVVDDLEAVQVNEQHGEAEGRTPLRVVQE